MCGPFLLIPVLKNRLRALFSALFYLVIASAAIWIITRTNTLTMVFQMLRAAHSRPTEDAGLLAAALAIGIPYKLAVPLIMVASLAVFGLLMAIYKNSGSLVIFAIVAVFSRLWTYNANYSNMILVFVLFPLWRIAQHEPSVRTSLVFFTMAASLWVPASIAIHRTFQIVEIIIWLSSLSYLLLYSPSDGNTRQALDNWFPGNSTDEYRNFKPNIMSSS
jgi:hypothetical protein